VAYLVGAKFVRDGEYTGGDVVQVITAALIGGFSLGQAAPNLAHFVAGRAAGFRLFRVMDQKPVINLEDEGTVPKGGIKVRR
jgi:ATP-binding cassette, subfamily B (MDR/TAP), member 1